MNLKTLFKTGDHVLLSVFIVIYSYLIISVATWITLLITATECERFAGKLPDADVLFQFFNTYLKPLSNLSNSVPNFRTHDDPSRKEMFHTIDAKIDSLKPYLQDNDTNVEPDTTIIEFHPRANDDADMSDSNVTFKIYKFKKLRDLIKVNLDKEMVSDKTKKVIIKTLDALISQLSKSRCTRSNGGDSVITFRNRDAKNLNITMNDWKNITGMYFKNFNESKINDSESLLTKVEELNDFFMNIMNDTIHFKKKQKLKCELVEAARPDLEDDTNSCARYKICSDELKIFMKDFYDATKLTVDTTLKNYEAMFMRDTNPDDVEERNTVEKVIAKLSNTYSERIDKIIEKHVNNFQLDERKDRDINIARLDKYVKEVTSHINEHVKKNIEEDMAPLKARTLLTMQDDIVANLEHDLVSLENDFIGKNCKYFNTCNGKSKKKKSKRRSDDDLFVNFKVSVDDEFKDILNSDAGVLPFMKSKLKARSLNVDRRALDYDKFKSYKVTRTTSAARKNAEMVKTTKEIPNSISYRSKISTTTQNILLDNPFKDFANRSIEIRLKLV